MRYPRIVEELTAGKSVTVVAHGNSMTPRIKSGQRLTVAPLEQPPEVGDVVLAKVHGNYYFHKVTAIRGDAFKISNNKGRDNGWTRQVFGKVVDVQ